MALPLPRAHTDDLKFACRNALTCRYAIWVLGTRYGYFFLHDRRDKYLTACEQMVNHELAFRLELTSRDEWASVKHYLHVPT